jgi:class 3 adenylate cyclase
VCKRYLPGDLVQEILDGTLSMEQPAQLRDVTILFSDLKGFTAISERLGPEGISEILNEYLSVMNEVIFEHGGTIDKFIGDAIMVIFGAPKDMDLSEQAQRATQCALAMNRSMRELAGRWAKFDASHLCMRIGIHQGPAVVGNFGSKRRSDYTCIGPTVNFAARIESVAEPGTVFTSAAVKAHLSQGDFEPAGNFKMKGLEQEQALVKLVEKSLA